MTSEVKCQIVQRLAKFLLDIQIIRIVQKEPTWGYKVKQAYEAEFGLKLRHGVLYPTLNSLEQQGFFTSEQQRYGGRNRKTYTITPKGKQYLQAYYSVLNEQIKGRNSK